MLPHRIHKPQSHSPRLVSHPSRTIAMSAPSAPNVPVAAPVAAAVPNGSAEIHVVVAQVATPVAAPKKRVVKSKATSVTTPPTAAPPLPLVNPPLPATKKRAAAATTTAPVKRVRAAKATKAAVAETAAVTAPAVVAPVVVAPVVVAPVVVAPVATPPVDMNVDVTHVTEVATGLATGPDVVDPPGPVVVGSIQATTANAQGVEEVPRVAPGDDIYVIRNVAGAVIRQRRADRYFDATAMCRAGGKMWGGYFRNKQTEEFLRGMTTSMQICTDLLIQSVTGGVNELRGTWVHPQVAYHLAQWISPAFAVAVSGWLDELATVLDVDPLGPVTVGTIQATTAVAQVVEDVPRVVPGGDIYVIRNVGGAVIRQRRADRYFDATAMCRAGGKRWGTYWQNAGTKRYLEELTSVIGIPTTDIVQVKQGGTNQGTWVHPHVSTHLAQWISASFEVAVNMWLDELATTGRVEIADDHVLRDPVAVESAEAAAAEAAERSARIAAGVRTALVKRNCVNMANNMPRPTRTSEQILMKSEAQQLYMYNILRFDTTEELQAEHPAFTDERVAQLHTQGIALSAADAGGHLFKVGFAHMQSTKERVVDFLGPLDSRVYLRPDDMSVSSSDSAPLWIEVVSVPSHLAIGDAEKEVFRRIQSRVRARSADLGIDVPVRRYNRSRLLTASGDTVEALSSVAAAKSDELVVLFDADDVMSAVRHIKDVAQEGIPLGAASVDGDNHNYDHNHDPLEEVRLRLAHELDMSRMSLDAEAAAEERRLAADERRLDAEAAAEERRLAAEERRWIAAHQDANALEMQRLQVFSELARANTLSPEIAMAILRPVAA
jgi:hypothetical protein